MSRLLLFFTLLLYNCASIAQLEDSKIDSNNSYKLYELQFESLLGARGVSKSEINDILKKYRASNISSNSDFAKILGSLYAKNEGIGILLFLYAGDSLQRLFFEPGKLIAQKTIKISKEKLQQIGNDINHVLGLYKAPVPTNPTIRGAEPESIAKTEGVTYESIFQLVTDLLIPEQFDDTYRHLLIIPALNIGTIPFALLKPYKNDTLLVEKCSYTFVPSIIDLLGLRSRILKEFTGWEGDMSGNDTRYIKPKASRFTFNNPLFISNPDYPKNTKYDFPDLPGAKKEIDSAKIFAKRFKLLEGKAAIKDTVLKYLRQTDVAYFATHGIANDVNPMENSFLVLSGDQPFLTAKNIMDSRLDTTYGKRFPEMVILSACQSGLGKAMEAGIAGLARSFLLSGSFHVIMSLWNVDDDATAYLMNRFVFHLQNRNLFMPSEPLRKAMIDTRTKYPDPSQWASFAVFGIDH